MQNNKLTDKKYWDLGYEKFLFSAMPENYSIVKKIFEKFKNTTDGEVFEIGCFPGRFLFHFGKLGYVLSGMDQTDFLDGMVKWFNKNNFKIGSFFKEDIFKINLDKKYDIVFSSGFIEHFTNFDEVIKIHCGLVKDNGYIFITTPNFSGSIQEKLHTIFDNENLEKHFLPSMNPDEWKKIIEDQGLKIIEYGYLGGFDFWVGNQKRSLLKKIIIKTIRVFTPIRWFPNSNKYSPEIYIIAQKI
jgi:2-polyprenyl-3-methyl-5-hydroxy-6-metoxy-1,4-benzoquinol methylase